MLVKCPECANEVSDAASACPKCGHPMKSFAADAAMAGATPSNEKPLQREKRSHMAGWLALAAFILANFTPAIIAPLFVLAALAFAGKEFSSGSKGFGAAMLGLALLQGWFVIDHFGQISGRTGVTTAREETEKAAKQYADVSLSAPFDWRSVAEDKCKGDWPTDYKMQQFCMTQQGKGVEQLSLGAPSDVDADAFRVIRGKCLDEWPLDFQMRAFCERQQFDGYRSMKASSISESARNACAQQWPNDYRMRRFCETKGG